MKQQKVQQEKELRNKEFGSRTGTPTSKLEAIQLRISSEDKLPSEVESSPHFDGC